MPFPLLGKIALAYLGIEAADALVIRRLWRRRTYRLAVERAKALGLPLIVVGAPKAGYINDVVGVDYGCGTLCIDAEGCKPTCKEQIRGRLEDVLPRFAPHSAVIYVSCTLEYVDDLPKVASELERVAAPGGLFIVRVAPGSSTFWLWPGAKWVVQSAPPGPWRFTRWRAA